MMRSRNSQVRFNPAAAAAVAAGAALATAGGARAAALVNLYVQARPSGTSGSFASQLSVTPGESLQFEVIGKLAQPTTANNNGKSTTSLSSSADGIIALKFDLTGSAPSTITGQALGTPGSNPPAAYDWSAGSGSSPGTLSTSDQLTGVRPILATNVYGAGVSNSDVLEVGTLTLGSSLPASQTLSGSWTSGGSGSFKINGGSTVFITGTTESSTDPYVNFAPLTLTSTPEPASIGLLALGTLGLLARRRRKPNAG